MTNSTPKLENYGVEFHSIDHIPETERHGKAGDQGPFWFTGNFQFLTISIGFIGPSMGLSFLWTSIAAVLGTVFGTVFMAFHATQGPVLGLPQMVQSRAQFGYRGVVVPLFGTLVSFGGFNVVCALLLMSGLRNLFGWNEYIVLTFTAIPCAMLAIFGYDWLHLVYKILFWVSLPLLSILTIMIAAGGVTHLPPPQLTFNRVAFAVEFAASASYNIGYAPFVSDYSRYLPRNTRPSSIIVSVFTGAALSASWLIALGAWLATRLNASDPLVALYVSGNAVFHGFGQVLVIDSVVVLAGLVALDNYSGSLALVTATDSFRTLKSSKLTRIISVMLITLLWVAGVLLCGGGAMGALTLTLTTVLYLLMPWTSINLVDYFFVRRGNYAILELLKPKGIYGTWAWRGLLAYAIGWVAILPFAVLPGLWTGPLAARIGGVDVGWLAGLVAAGGSYFLMSRRTQTEEGVTILSSSAELEGIATDGATAGSRF